MLILLVEEVGEGAPAEKGATFSAATHSAWHANTASLRVETGAADSALCLPTPSWECSRLLGCFTGGDGRRGSVCRMG